MKEKLHLRTCVKTTFCLLILWAIIIGYLLLLSDKLEKIESGQIIQVSEEYMK